MKLRPLSRGDLAARLGWLALALAVVLGFGAWRLFPAVFGPRVDPKLSAFPGVLQRAPYADVVIVGTLAHDGIREASGMAPSRVNRDILWVLNDSGNEPELYTIGTQGAALSTCRIGTVRNTDWEDLASFRWQGDSYLLIADTGDNGGKRNDCALLVVREPGEAAFVAGAVLTLPVAWTLRFRYEDGPRDCESVAVDVAAERVLLLSKRTVPPVLYELPLRPAGTGVVEVARRVVAVSSMPAPPKGKGRRHRSQPTAMDLTSDGTALAILTGEHGYLYERSPGEPWAQALGRPPLGIVLPPEKSGLLKQREALCFADGTRQLFVTSEGRHAHLGRLDWTARPPGAD
jgi:hypothetical protein